MSRGAFRTNQEIQPLTRTIVQLTSNNNLEFFFRQTPQGDGVWEDTQFNLVNGRYHADWLIAYDEPNKICETDLPKARRILFRTEPKSIKYYSSDFLNQFGAVVSIDENSSFDGQTILSQVALPWMYGLDFERPEEAYTWDALAADKAIPQKGELSVVCSTKNMNVNQSRRLRFLTMLKEALGDRMTMYGRGFRPIADKREAIDGYRYHLVLENNLLADGWTEKLADPILGGVFPISAGSPNLGDYFNPEGFASIDITKPRQAVAQVLDILDRDIAAEAVEVMKENKQRLMQQHNFFSLCSRVIKTIEASQGGRDIQRLESAYSFRPNRMPKWKKLGSVPKPLRPLSRKIYLSLFERQ